MSEANKTEGWNIIISYFFHLSQLKGFCQFSLVSTFRACYAIEFCSC
jgi:hypothetical protein